MTDKDKALRLALEALESLFNGQADQNRAERCSNAITAIKAALSGEAQTRSVDKDEPVVWNEGVPAMLPKQKEGETFIVSYEPKLEAKDEPVAWTWHQAPVKTSWGDGMVVADFAIDKDHTVSIYCERDQTAKVEAMFTPPQRKPLTDEQIGDEFVRFQVGGMFTPFLYAVRAIEAAHGIIDPTDLKGEA